MAAAAAASELPADWQARLRRRLAAAPDHRLEHSRPAGLARESAPTLARLRAQWPPTLTAAAVLLPIIDRPHHPALLMTRRASHLRRHAGQICFPGGRMEADDADLAAAAVRETREEIGIGSAHIEPIGYLSDHVVLTGYRITPVVGLLAPDLTPVPDGTEVAEVFELPLAVALTADSYRIGRRTIREVEVDTWELVFGAYQIWGATAGILAHLREVFSETAA
ncbi:MAG TPA: CoA pyrophosphatase [Steroidobacteraceae bacterium]|jgi:8-oxo-dGTP pyrophosphatase MutT (NUDIX family)